MNTTTDDTTAHIIIQRRELGYSRPVCAEDGMDWPCPTVAQAREDADQDAAKAWGHSEDGRIGRVVR